MWRAQRNTRYRNERRENVCASMRDSQVVNLSPARLPAAAVRALTKGLKFVPGKLVDPVEILGGVEWTRLQRNIRLQFCFDEDDGPKIAGFPVPSNFAPPEIAQAGVEQLLAGFKLDLKMKIEGLYNNSWVPTNLSRVETQSLTNLRKNQEIVIKPADKGGAIVIMSKEKYLAEGFKNLNRPEYYEALVEPTQPQTIKMVNELLFDMLLSKAITSKEYHFLRPPMPCKPRVYYQLPKIQKPRESWPDPQMPAGRPIVANVGTELTNLSRWVDYWLQELAQLLFKDNVVKDSYDFIKRLEDLVLPKDSNLILLAADVKDLYTNIPHEAGIEAVMAAWEKPSTRPCRPAKAFIKRALELILKRNDMEFAGKFYLQKKGVAMGTNCAPAIANIFMEKIDQKVREFHPLGYFRFLDDLFIIWDGNRPDIDAFKTALNAVDQNIQLVYADSRTSNVFLDVEIMVTPRLLRDGKLDYKVYIKPTDTLQLLHRRSCHPEHTFRGIVKSQIIRHLRLSSHVRYFEASWKRVADVLLRRGYTARELKRIKNEVIRGGNLELKRNDAQARRSNYLIMKWSPILRELPKWAREYWHNLLNLNSSLKEKCPPELTISWKRPQNIQETVVRAAVTIN
jgi:hypothetical protein